MPWCPKCRTEYREQVQSCSDCETELVDELVDELAFDEPLKEYDSEDFLISVGSGMQAEILESKLKFYGIPVIRKYRESGHYLKVYMGATPFGIDLYVPSKLLADAKELIENNAETFVTNDDSYQDFTENTENHNTAADENNLRRTRARSLIIILFFLPFLIWIIYGLIQTIIRFVN